MIALRLLAAASLLTGASAPTPISERDFEQLMRAAVRFSAERSQVQATTKTICVNSKLDPPAKYSADWMKGMPKDGELPQALRDQGFNPAIARAIASGFVAAEQTRMPPLPSRFVMFSRDNVPTRCIIDHRPTGGDDSVVTLTFTRPLFANGYAFIDEVENCPGLCGAAFLRVFRKKNGKWTQVSLAIPTVS